MLRTTVLRRFFLLPVQHRQPTSSIITPLCARALHRMSSRGTPAKPSLLLKADLRISNTPTIPRRVGQSLMAFHSTPPRQGPPLIAVLASVLKASASIEYARMAGRVALTFLPVFLIKNHMIRKYIRYVIQNKPEMEDKKIHLQTQMKQHTTWWRSLLLFPVIIFSLTLVASLERAPLTGRWRLILLSPEEEEEIANQLAGVGWYKAVGEILSQDGPQTIIPATDWRYQWVQSTLRQLESIIPILAVEHESDTPWLERGPEDVPLPPPAKYPLRQRPMAKDVLRWFCEMSCARVAPPAPHSIPGPPYSLVIVDRPDCHNAFSFGFGPDGGGGIVVYSGFLDEILASNPEGQTVSKLAVDTNDAEPAKPGLWKSLLGSFNAISPPQTHPCPTPEQTSQLAILLAHELAHLILSHHLETLSSGTVIIPGTLSMVTDLVRALLFPITMMFGPFVNDAVANLGKLGSGEVGMLHEYCTSVSQEFEADTVSARLLAHAGFDARNAVRFWEKRHELETSECTPKKAKEDKARVSSLPRMIMGSTHPVHQVRVQKLKQELHRWETERQEKLQWTRRADTDTIGIDIDKLAGRFE